MPMKQHYVHFFSPGTLFPEETTKAIKSWDAEAAAEMAHGIRERYGATPYAFQFSTRERRDNELDSHETKRSVRYYLGGKIETLDEIKTRNDPKERILVSNMEGNGWDRILVNTNSWKACLPLDESDVILHWTPRKKEGT